MNFFETFLKTRWYVMIGFAGAALIYAALFMQGRLDAMVLGLVGGAFVAFACGRADCMTKQTRPIDIRHTPMGMGAALVEEEFHIVKKTGYVLYGAAIIMTGMAAYRAWWVYW